MGGPDLAARHHSHFVCSCLSGDQRKHADELYQRALDFLAGGTKSLIPQEGERHFVTHAVQSLWWDWGIDITGIFTDQWSVVKAKGLKPRDSKEEPMAYWIECDRIEDGLAYLLMDAPKDPPNGEM